MLENSSCHLTDIIQATSNMPTNLLWKAFELHDLFFCFLYPNPVHVNVRSNTLAKDKLSWRHIPWLIVTFFFFPFVAGGALGYIFIQEMFIGPPRITSLITYFIYAGSFIGIILTLTTNLLPLLDSDCIAGFNQVQLWCIRLREEFPEMQAAAENNNKKDTIGLLLYLMVLAMAPGHFFTAFLAVLLELDQLDYIFEDFLPHPTIRELLPHIVVPFLIRCVLTSLIIFEGSRAIIFGFLFLAASTKSATAGFLIMAKVNIPQSEVGKDKFFLWFEQLRMINAMGRVTSGLLAGIFTSCGQVSTVILLWITINGGAYSNPVLTYGLCPFIAINVVAFTIVMLQEAIAFCELSRELVSDWRIGVISRQKDEQSNCFKLAMDPEVRRRGRGQRSVKFQVFGTITLQKGFEITYLSVLMDNLTNAVLLIPY